MLHCADQNMATTVHFASKLVDSCPHYGAHHAWRVRIECITPSALDMSCPFQVPAGFEAMREHLLTWPRDTTDGCTCVVY
jgi:hypothetical protein